MEPVEQRWRAWMQFILGLSLTFLFFYMMAPFLVAILLGAVVAIIVYPLYQQIKSRMPRSLAGLIVTLATAVGILLPMFFILYSGSYRLLSLFTRIKLPKEGSLDGVIHHPKVTAALNVISRFTPVDQDWLKTQSVDVIQNIIEKVSGVVAAFIAGMPGLLVAFSIVIISVYFFLVDGARFLRFLSSLSPLKIERSNELYNAFEKSCRGVVLGLFASSLIQSFLMGIFFWITGLPTPFFVAVITIFMGMVPVVGSAPIWIGGTAYLFLSGRLVMGIVMLVGGILISGSDNIVRPLVMKGQSEMHPLLALVSVFGAVDLFGATGIFLGPVIAAVFVSFLRIVSLEIRRDQIVLPAEISPTPRVPS